MRNLNGDTPTSKVYRLELFITLFIVYNLIKCYTFIFIYTRVPKYYNQKHDF